MDRFTVVFRGEVVVDGEPGRPCTGATRNMDMHFRHECEMYDHETDQDVLKDLKKIGGNARKYVCTK